MPEIDYSSISGVLRLVDRPLWIVTATDGARRGGLVATWVTQSSLDPRQPTMMAALAPESSYDGTDTGQPGLRAASDYH